MKRFSTRNAMLEVMREYPKGINAAKLSKEIQIRHNVEKEYIAVMLCQLRTKGVILKLPQKCCTECGKKITLYKLA